MSRIFKFILLMNLGGIIGALLSEISFINWQLSLFFWLSFLGINGVGALAYVYDESFIKALKLKDESVYNVGLIILMTSFNLFLIYWRWSYVR